eukprot:7784654-Pyramimonas_sp.AAC.1
MSGAKATADHTARSRSIAQLLVQRLQRGQGEQVALASLLHDRKKTRPHGREGQARRRLPTPTPRGAHASAPCPRWPFLPGLLAEGLGRALSSRASRRSFASAASRESSAATCACNSGHTQRFPLES